MTLLPTTTNLIECGVCNGRGTLIHIDWNSAETLPPRKTCRCWMCNGRGAHPAQPETRPLPADAPVNKHGVIIMRLRSNALRIVRHHRPTCRTWALTDVSEASRTRLARIAEWNGWITDVLDTASGVIVSLVHCD